ncbi:hypothetical protein [Pseudomonas sp. zjy_11]|uniref:hypothetical protein n=1 Tax=unclassified Pseudomonas TaxID=196821 RepID=UPI00370CB591
MIDAYFGWRAVMLILAGMGLMVWINSLLNLPEPLPHHQRETLSLSSACRTYLTILADRLLLRPALAMAAVFFFLLAYISDVTLVYRALWHDRTSPRPAFRCHRRVSDAGRYV